MGAAKGRLDKAEREKQTPKPNSPPDLKQIEAKATPIEVDHGDGELDQGDEVDQND
jgi:hypothetical protein